MLAKEVVFFKNLNTLLFTFLCSDDFKAVVLSVMWCVYFR